MKKINIKGFILRLFPINTMSKVTKPLPKTAGKAIRVSVYAFLVLVYIFVISGVIEGIHEATTYPDPSRPNMSLSAIKQEEKQQKIDAQKAEEQKDLALKAEKEEEDKKAKEVEDKAKEEAAKLEAEEKAKAEKEATEKARIEAEEKAKEEAEQQRVAAEQERAKQQAAEQAKNGEIITSGIYISKGHHSGGNNSGGNNSDDSERHATGEGEVYVAAHGKGVYHGRLNCFRMKNATKISLAEAKRRGLRPCRVKGCN